MNELRALARKPRQADPQTTQCDRSHPTHNGPQAKELQPITRARAVVGKARPQTAFFNQGGRLKAAVLPVRRAATAFRNALGAAPAAMTLVPVPPSKARTDPLYDDRVARMLPIIWPGQAAEHP